jgi:hypothetical protein
MSSRAKELLRRFLSLRYIPPLLIIILAFVGTLVDRPFGLQRDQVLLGLLAFLAIDALIERIELLTDSEEDVTKLRELATSQTAGKGFLRFRRDFPRTEDMIAEARKEIWVSGIALDTMARLTEVFDSKLEKGFNLRFLAVNPQEDTVREISGYLGEDAGDLAGRVRINLKKLHRRLAQAYPQRVNIRVIDHRPALGYFVVDPHLEQGYMTVASYLYQTEGSELPIITLSQRAHPQWFNVYLKEFEMLWDGAAKWEP